MDRVEDCLEFYLSKHHHHPKVQKAMKGVGGDAEEAYSKSEVFIDRFIFIFVPIYFCIYSLD
jgi:hypothetical protein